MKVQRDFPSLPTGTRTALRLQRKPNRQAQIPGKNSDIRSEEDADEGGQVLADEVLARLQEPRHDARDDVEVLVVPPVGMDERKKNGLKN